MAEYMKLEWVDNTGYHSQLLEHNLAWAMYYELEDEGIQAGIESMSAFELEQYKEGQNV